MRYRELMKINIKLFNDCGLWWEFVNEVRNEYQVDKWKSVIGKLNHDVKFYSGDKPVIGKHSIKLVNAVYRDLKIELFPAKYRIRGWSGCGSYKFSMLDINCKEVYFTEPVSLIRFGKKYEFVIGYEDGTTMYITNQLRSEG